MLDVEMTHRDFTMEFTNLVYFGLVNAMSCGSLSKSPFPICLTPSLLELHASLDFAEGMVSLLLVATDSYGFCTKAYNLVDLAAVVTLRCFVFYFEGDDS